MDQFNHNPNWQNEVNPRESNRGLRFHSSSSSRVGFNQRDPDMNHRHYQESVHMVPTNDHNVGVCPRESVGPSGMNISSSSSFPGTVQRFPFGYEMEEEGNGDSRRFPFKRRRTEDYITEYVAGESSSTGIPRRQVAPYHQDNVSGHSRRHLEARIGLGASSTTTWPFSQLHEHTQNFQNNINLHAHDNNRQAFMALNVYSSNEYIRSGSFGALPTQQPHPFFMHGMGNWAAHDANINFPGSFSHPSGQHRSAPGIQQPNYRAWVVAPSIAFPWQRSSNPSPTGLWNFIYGNERRSVGIQGGGNDTIDSTLRIEQVRRTLEHVRNGGSLRLEDLMPIDHSILLDLLEAQRHMDLPHEIIAALDDQMSTVETGLNEEQILCHIGLEFFQPITEGTPENEVCCICQEDYVNGEELGKLDCGHRFHLACIKQWLVMKNTCPICKRMALAVEDEEEQGDE